jgi:glycosyltransferase involved in cell wall biosynthesis
LPDAKVIHQTGDIHYVALGVWRRPVVLTIHDLRFIEEASGLRRLLFRWLWLELPCWRASVVTVISEFTRQRLLKFCRVKPEKVRVVPNCVAPEFVPLEKFWPKSVVRMLIVGTTANKNLERVVEACTGLDLSLVILGCLNEEQKRLLGQSGLKFEEHSGLLRADVVGLYQNCDLICFVSTYEGFGMPILEGQAVGRPVLTSALSPMREVAGGGSLLVNPFEPFEIREGVMRLISEPALREELVKKGFENVARYSVKAIAAKYSDLYLKAMGVK